MKKINAVNKIRKYIANKIDSTPKSVGDSDILTWLGIDETSKNVRSEITYFTCLKILSETLGKLSLKTYKRTEKGREAIELSDINRVLKVRPNEYTTPAIFWSTIEQNRNHFGNAYVWCRWSGAKLIDLWIMQSDCVEIYVDNHGFFGKKNKVWYVYNDPKSGERHIFQGKDVLHFKTSHTLDGITGLPVREILRDTLEGNLNSQQYMNKLYKQGLTGKAILQYTGDLDKKAQRKLVSFYEEFSNGIDNTGKIIPVPIGMTLQPLNIKFTDVQFFELRKYSSLQIAGAFGIKPNHINDYEKSSYSNSEMQQLSFYVDTLQFILKQYEEETTFKLLTNKQIEEGCFFKYNERAILRADTKTQMETLTAGVNNGIYTPNEAREFVDLPEKEGGDILITNGNYIPITEVGKQYEKGGVNNE
ncbi:TPA: phage portal protein [Clostridioides difficile]